VSRRASHISACKSEIIDEKEAATVPRGSLRTLQDCEDFIQGCLFLGTGGGGSPEIGMRILKKALEDGITLGWVDADDIPDDVWSVNPCGTGSIAPVSEETLEEIEAMGLVDTLGDDALIDAVKELENYLGRSFGCVVAFEPGAENTPDALVVGGRLGIPVVDGDYAGRAVPEDIQSTTHLHGIHAWPFSAIDKWGNITIVKNCANPRMGERLGKHLALAAFGDASTAITPISAREMKEVLVRGTLSKCLAIGKATRAARKKGEDPVDAIVEITDGWRLFEGIVTGKDWEDRDGYMFGTTHVRGTGDHEGHTLDVWFKNENHVSWLDGEPWICSPDIVTFVLAGSGEGVTNSDIKEGDEVVAVGIKGLEDFRTEFGLNECTGPRYFGFDIDYVPIEKLVAAA
jgi:DUF917 family protein